MPILKDMLKNPLMRDQFKAYLKRIKMLGLYEFAMTKTTAKDNIAFILKDPGADAIVTVGVTGKRLAAKIIKEAQDASAGLKIVSDAKLLSEDPRWTKHVKYSKERCVKEVQTLLNYDNFEKSREYKAYQDSLEFSSAEYLRYSREFAKSFEISPEALKVFEKQEAIAEAMWQKALEKYAPKDPPKRKKKMPTAKDFMAFMKKKKKKS